VTPSLNNNTLFIGLLVRTWKEEEILGWFKEKFQGVQSFELMMDTTKKGENRGFGFLVFDEYSHALEAHKSYREKGLTIKGTDLSVDWAEPKEEPDEEAMQKVKAVYVCKLDEKVTEENLKTAFEKFGEIEKIVMSNQMQSSKRKDYAFVMYMERESALKAIEEMQEKSLTEFPDKPMDVSLAKPQSKRQGGMRGGRGGRRGGRRGGGRMGSFRGGRYNTTGGRGGSWSGGMQQQGYGFQQQPMMQMMPMQMQWGYAAPQQTGYTMQYQQYQPQQQSYGGQNYGGQSNQGYYYQQRY